MSQNMKKTRSNRAAKAAKAGRKNKRRKENRGTTASFPLEGKIPSLRAGQAIAPEKILVPAAN